MVASGDSVALDAVLAWALVGSSAEASIVDPDELELTEGIAALLRWSDGATEHDRAPSMPGHGQLREPRRTSSNRRRRTARGRPGDHVPCGTMPPGPTGWRLTRHEAVQNPAAVRALA